MNKYQVTIRFQISEAFMRHVPAHRTLINNLISSGIIDQYAVSIEAGKGWITINADSRAEVVAHLKKSPLHRFWEMEIDELFVFDSKIYRFPKLVMN